MINFGCKGQFQTVSPCGVTFGRRKQLGKEQPALAAGWEKHQDLSNHHSHGKMLIKADFSAMEARENYPRMY